jgi:predicted component of type VI protein secretion system
MPTLRSISSVLEGRAFEVQGSYVMIGSAADNTVRLEHGSVSAHHAILTVGDGGFKLWDLHSANGMKINGKPAAVAYLQDGDQVLLGEVALRFESGRDGKRETRAPAGASPPPVSQVSEIVPGAAPAPLSPAQQPPGSQEPLQAEQAPATQLASRDDRPPSATVQPPPLTSPRPLPPGPLAQMPAPTVEAGPAIQPSQTVPLEPANPPDTAPAGAGQEGPAPPRRMKAATVRRLIWAGVFLWGIIMFGVGSSEAGHVFNFIGIVMIVVGGAALFVNLRCGSLVAPPRNRDEPNDRR